MNIIKHRKLFLTFSGTLTLISIILWIIWGLNLGIDFTGGSLLEVEYPKARPSVSQINQTLADLNLRGLKIQAAGESDYILRFQDTGEEIHQKILAKLNEQANPSSNQAQAPVTVSQSSNSNAAVNVTGVSVNTSQNQVIEKKFDSIGPSIGAELKTKAFYAVILVVISIIIYIALAFRKVSYPVSSWKYGVAAIPARA